MDIFDKDLVRYIWEDDLDGVECFVADDIDTLKSQVNSKDSIMYEIEKNPTGIGFKGKVNERTWNFAYYDPQYDVKRKTADILEEIEHLRKLYTMGYGIQVWEDYDAGEDSYEDTHEGHWRDDPRPTWELAKKYRLAPGEEEGYLPLSQRRAYKNAIDKLYNRTGVLLVDDRDPEKDFEHWWQEATIKYTMPLDVNKHWCKLAFMAGRGE